MKNPASKASAPSHKPSSPAPRTILVLVRHGDAGEALALPERDAVRPLTPKGRKQARRAGKALARMGLAPRDVWTSRLLRAQETARAAVAAAGEGEDVAARITSTAALAPDAVPERIVRALLDTPPPPPTPEAKAAPRSARGRRPAGRGPRGPIEAAPVVRWVVGHDPHLGRLAAFAIGAPPASIRLPKGAFAVLGFDGRGPGPGTGVLTHLFDPDGLKAVRRRHR